MIDAVDVAGLQIRGIALQWWALRLPLELSRRLHVLDDGAESRHEQYLHLNLSPRDLVSLS